MTIEDNLQERIAELEQALRDVRDSAAYNLEEPGNENDTLDSIVDQVSSVLHERNYEFDKRAYLGDDYDVVY